MSGQSWHETTSESKKGYANLWVLLVVQTIVRAHSRNTFQLKECTFQSKGKDLFYFFCHYQNSTGSIFFSSMCTRTTTYRKGWRVQFEDA